MGFFTDLLGGSSDVRESGGGFDPAISEKINLGLSDLTRSYEQGPRVFEGPRVAGFTDPQLQAQTSLLALSTAQPDYFTTALGDIEEARGLQRQAVAPVTAQDIAAQRQLLEGTAEAQKLAARQTFEETIRDIGLGAVGGGAGAIEGARADILRGGAAGQLAMTSAQIESQLQQQALQQTQADRAARERAATGLATLGGQALDISRAGFGEAQERARLAAGVGAQQQALEQQQIQAEMAKFAEADPMAFAQRYLTTVYAAPTRQTQYSQDPSTFQEAIGLATAFANNGGVVKKSAGGLAAIAEIASAVASGSGGAELEMSQAVSRAEGAGDGGDGLIPSSLGFGSGTPKQEMDKFASVQLNTGSSPKKGFLAKLGEKAKEKFSDNIFTDDKGLSGLYMSKEGDKNDLPKKDQADPAKEGEQTESRVTSQEAMAAGAPTIFRVDDSTMFAKQRAARDAMNKQLGRRANNGGGIANLAVGGGRFKVARPIPIARPPRPGEEPARPGKEEGAFNRILSGVGSGLKSLGSGIQTGYGYYKENIDPFRDYSEAERRRIGLGILAAQPKLGESPLTTVARGAMGPIDKIKAEELARAKQRATLDAARLRAIKDVKPLPNTIFDNINQTIASLYGAKVTRDATGRVIGIDSSALSDDVADKMNRELRETIRIAEKTYQSDPANIYDKTLTYITENVGPKK